MGRGGNKILQKSIQAHSSRGKEAVSNYQKFKKDKLNIIYLTTDQQVKEVAKLIRQINPQLMSLDLETASQSAGFGPAKGSFSGTIRTIQLGLDEPERGIKPMQILIDCHKASPRPFVPFLRSRGIEKQIHFLDYEQSWSLTQLGTSIGQIYDTRLAYYVIQRKLKKMSDQEIQAVFPEYRPHSNRLDDLTKNLMGIELPKTNQASDWGKQQLSPDQLIYAAMDVAILPELTRKVKENASKLGLEKEIDLEIEKRKQQILNQVENAKQKNNDDSKRVIRALGRCRTKAELQRCLEVSKQMTILAENQSEVINIYKEKRNDLLT
jgi:hypothetical protein